MTSNTLTKVTQFCKKNTLLTPNDKVVIGVSGGPDSLCLLHLMLALKPVFQLTLIVAHLNHQLRDTDSQGDADFVQEMAMRWQLPLVIESKDIAKLAARRKQSIEEAARQIRYAFLWRTAAEHNAHKIAVGHNSDDQVETVVMHFLRGTGLAGLRGMVSAIELSTLILYSEDVSALPATPSPVLIRPLLEISRAEIEFYCQENQLSPRQDSSNLDTTFYRNRLRHELIPTLETYNPNIREVLQRTAKVITAETEILNKHLDKAWHQVIKDETANNYSQLKTVEFKLTPWLSLPLALKRSTLRRAVHLLRRNLRDIGFEHIETAINILENGRTGTQATLPQGLVLTIGYQTFTITSKKEALLPHKFDGPLLGKGQMLPVNLPGITHLPNTNWQLEARILSQGDLDQSIIKQADRWETYLDADIAGPEITLRSRRPGDTFCPFGLAGHHKKVNEFMINKKIPANWRNHIPLLVSPGQILWICGYRPDERAGVRTDTKRVLHLKFRHR